MAAAFFALLIVLLTGTGARDQLLLAAMVSRQGQRPGLLLVALVSGVATVAFAAWASQVIAAAMGSDARLIFAAMALGLAGAEMVIARRLRLPAEPTGSLGAFALVLVAGQLTDATRFTILGLAVATHAPLLAGLGGAIAAVVLALAGWLAADELLRRDLTLPRRLVGAMILAVAAYLAMRALGRI